MWCCISLGKGQFCHLVATPLILLMQSVLVSEVVEYVSASTLVPEFSKWCLIHEWLLAVLLVMGRKVGNDLCHHLSDSTSLVFSFFGASFYDWIINIKLLYASIRHGTFKSEEYFHVFSLGLKFLKYWFS